MPLHNYHVYQYFCWLELVAGQDHYYMAQLHFYTLAQLELDPTWQPIGSSCALIASLISCLGIYGSASRGVVLVEVG